MTIDEALLYDAEWWLVRDIGHELTGKRIFDIMSDLRTYWGWESKPGADHESWFNLLIREAIKC